MLAGVSLASLEGSQGGVSKSASEGSELAARPHFDELD